MYPIIYVVANPVRALLDTKRSEEHLQSSNESMENKTKHKIKRKRHKERNNLGDWSVGLDVDRVWPEAQDAA